MRTRERQQSAREPREPLGLALDVREKAVALGRIILRARLQHLDRADDRRQRRPKLVRRVRDELAFRKLAPLLLGQVVEHDHHRVALGLRRDADERERTLLVGPHVRLRERRPGVEEARSKFAQRERRPRLGQLVALGEAHAEHAPRLGIGELHDELLVDGDDAFVQPLEQHAEPVALALDMPERTPKLPPHAVEALRERAELVAELVADGTLEVAGGNRLRSGVSRRRRNAISCASSSPTSTPINPAITPAFNA